MCNPYTPPRLPNDNDREDEPYDENWLGRECFGWICLLLTGFYVLDTFVQIFKEYYYGH